MLCKCGCGNKPKSKNGVYCRGHNKHSEETKKMIGINSGSSRRGKKRGKYKSISGDKHWQFKKGCEPHNKGVPNPELSERNRKRKGEKHTRDHKQKIGIASKKIWSDPEFHSGMCEKLKEAANRPEVKAKNSQRSTERWKDEEYKERLKKKHKETWEGNEKRKEAAVKRMNKVHSEGKIDHSSRIKKSLSSNGKHPNKTEIFVDSLIQKARPADFIYSGNGKIYLSGRVPDWFNVNGKKQVIEFLGDYWHGEKRTGRTKEQEEKMLRSHYKKYGYDCLIIWESELKDPDKVVEKIKEFNGGKLKCQ